VISITGMTVVFIGLLLTSLVIYSFSFLPRLLEYLGKRGEERRTAPKEKQVEKIDPDVLAVIATVLEVERRLHFSFEKSKFTFKDRRPTSGLI
jgi:Na+-transporting methylmalonyl-CoA/oxaloacetate decarboxylase gamma subunit